MFHVTKVRPARVIAKKWDAIARKHPGGGFVEVNVRPGSALGINNGQYQGWFEVNNLGSPFNEDHSGAILKECGIAPPQLTIHQFKIMREAHTTPISEVNSLGIQAVAKRDGITEALFVGDNGEQGDARVEIWDVGGMLVANTNGDPVWQESMPAEFEELMETIQFAP